MRPARLALEVEDGDESVAIADVQLFLWYPLSNDISVVVDADDGVVSVELSEELVIAGFVDSDLSAFFFTWQLGLCNESLDQVVDITTLSDEDVIVVLQQRER